MVLEASKSKIKMLQPRCLMIATFCFKVMPCISLPQMLEGQETVKVGPASSFQPFCTVTNPHSWYSALMIQSPCKSPTS